MKLRLGTRGSKLAIAQSMQVKALLEMHYSYLEIELMIIKTTGDKNQEQSLQKMNDKGVFVKEIEEALLQGEIDFAVHSMKDMPSIIDHRLCFCKTLLREDARDVLVLANATSLDELPKGSKIATCSMRRAIQLKALRNDIKIIDIRGNVETRIRKMKEEGFDGLILAAAGIHRLHMEEAITQYLSEHEMIPSAAQGALAIQVRCKDVDLLRMINALHNPNVEDEVYWERELLKVVNAGCHTPFGVRVHLHKDELHILAMLGDEQGVMTKVEEICDKHDAHRCITHLAKRLKQGALR